VGLTEPQEPPRDDDGEHIFTVVAGLARRASDGQLVVAAATGIAAAAVVGLVRPAWWLVALPLLCVGSFGIWGIAERSGADRAATAGAALGSSRLLACVRVAAAVIGTLSAVLTLLALVAMAIGTWIS
jgi:hypothetical protein